MRQIIVLFTFTLATIAQATEVQSNVFINDVSNDTYSKKMALQLTLSCQIQDRTQASIPGKELDEQVTFKKTNETKTLYKNKDLEVKVTIPVVSINWGNGAPSIITNSSYRMDIFKKGKLYIELNNPIGSNFNFFYPDKNLDFFCRTL
ncbi:MAG: hypothetical protein KDD33_00795 [Bdellovibrionales bacterium]|nr:hypothetical protein [Bdellovibrionales bacterium]